MSSENNGVIIVKVAELFNLLIIGKHIAVSV